MKWDKLSGQRCLLSPCDAGKGAGILRGGYFSPELYYDIREWIRFLPQESISAFTRKAPKIADPPALLVNIQATATGQHSITTDIS